MKFFSRKKTKNISKPLTFNHDKIYLVFQNDRGDELFNVISDSRVQSIVLATSILQELINESLVKANKNNDNEAVDILNIVKEFVTNIKTKAIEKNVNNYDFIFLVKKIEEIAKNVKFNQ
jgi:DNA-binding protein